MIPTLLLAKLITAHVTGDFVLQWDKGIASRNRHHYRSGYLYLHGSMHFLLAWLATGSFYGWWVALLIGVGHILLDGGKAWLNQHGLVPFLIDQSLHFLILFSCWIIFAHIPFRQLVVPLQQETTWWLIGGYLTVIFFYSRLIAMATAPWRKDIPLEREKLKKAGRWIGYIERTLIYIFILIDVWSGVGFLLAAKSVFRFGDLREGKDKGHTEYVLIGTLLSFELTIITALVVKRLIQ